MRSSTLQKPARVSPVSIAPENPSRRLPVILLVLATVASLWPACIGEFTWDDSSNISKNAFLNPPSLPGILHFWAEPFFRMYIPVTYTLWGVLAMGSAVSVPDAQGSYLNPYVFHIANLLVHVLNVLIVFRLIEAIGAPRWSACGGAMLFALHPLQVEPVAWATGMKDVLSTTFSLLALWQLLDFYKSSDSISPNQSSRLRKLHYAAAIIAFLAALLSKPSAVVVPLLALVLGRGLLRRTWRELGGSLLPFFILAAADALIAKHVQTTVNVDAGPLWARPLLAAHALAFYCYMLRFPVRLGILYAQTPQTILDHHWLFYSWIVPAGISAVAWVFRRKAPWLWVGWALFVIALLPVLGLVPFDFEQRSLVADRYVYLAMLGPALIVAYAISLSRLPRWATVLACAAVLALFGLRSFLQTWVWQSNSALFHHALEVNPNSALACDNLAADAISAGNTDEAAAMARQSESIDRHGVTCYLVLGDIAVRQQQYAEALRDYRTAHENEPNNPEALVRLAGCFAEHGPGEKSARLPLAIDLCRQAISYYPFFAQSREALAGFLAEQHHDSEAIEQAQIALNLAPNNLRMELLLGDLLARNGQRDQAAAHYAAALRLDPQSTAARDGLAKMGKS